MQHISDEHVPSQGMLYVRSVVRSHHQLAICPSLPSQGRIGYQVYVIYSRWVVSHCRKKLIMTGVMRAGIQQSACSSIDEVASFHHLMEHVSLIKPVVYQGLVQVLCLNALLMFPGKGRWADNRDMLRKHCFAARVP